MKSRLISASRCADTMLLHLFIGMRTDVLVAKSMGIDAPASEG